MGAFVSIAFFMFPIILFISLIVFVIFSILSGVISAEISKPKYQHLTYTKEKASPFKDETTFKTDKVIDLDKHTVNNPPKHNVY